MGASYAIIWLHCVLGSLVSGRKNFVPHPFLEECACTCIALSSAGCCCSAKQAISHQPHSLFLQFSGTSSQNAFPHFCYSSPDSAAHAGLSDGKNLAAYEILDWHGFVGIPILRTTGAMQIAQVPHNTCTCRGSGNTSTHSAISHFPVIKGNSGFLLPLLAKSQNQKHRIAWDKRDLKVPTSPAMGRDTFP